MNKPSVSTLGFIERDNIAITSIGAVASADVGVLKTVTLTQSYSGTTSNYAITDQSTSPTANITAKAITISGITAAGKAYDGTNSATLTKPSVSSLGFVARDNIEITTIGTFDVVDVGIQTVTLTQSYSGTTSNYTITDQANKPTAAISAKAITISGITAAGKTYDGTNSVTLTKPSVSSLGFIARDSIVINTTGVFDVVDVGTQSVTLAQSYGGTTSNYTITDQTVKPSAAISAKAITISGITATNKVYDGSTSISLVLPTVSSLGFIARDSIAITTSGAVASADVGSGKTVTLTQSYSGTTSNYTITNQSSSPTVNITAKPITISGITATGKVYDGTNSVTLSKPLVSTLGFIARDRIVINTTGTFDTVDVGTQLVTLTQSYGGTTSNYTITDQSTKPSAVISAKAITISGITATGKTYDGTDSVTLNKPNVSSLGFITRDNIIIETTGTFDVVDVGTQSVTLAQSYSGTTSNYTITDQATKPTAAISAKAITVSGITATGKVYDGSSSVTLNKPTVSTLGFIARDNIVINTTGVFDIVDVGTRSVTLTQSYGGTVSNYSITNQVTKPRATITAKPITISGITANDKVYNGNNSVVLNKPTVDSLGFIPRDTILINTTGVLDDVNVGTQTVTLTQSYSGTTSNYIITNQSTKPTASVTPKTLTIGSATAVNKVYDGTNEAFISSFGSLSGMIGTQTLNVAVNTALFDSPDVGNGRVATISYTLSNGSNGGMASNYSLADTTATANIGKRTITISGIVAADKQYDGTNNVTLIKPSVSSLGFHTRDNIAITTTGTFDAVDLGMQTVTLVQSYSGTVSNYNIINQTTKPRAVITEFIVNRALNNRPATNHNFMSIYASIMPSKMFIPPNPMDRFKLPDDNRAQILKDNNINIQSVNIVNTNQPLPNINFTQTNNFINPSISQPIIVQPATENLKPMILPNFNNVFKKSPFSFLGIILDRDNEVIKDIKLDKIFINRGAESSRNIIGIELN